MANEYPSWWANRWGDIASATVTPSQREPVYGLVGDLALTPMRPGTYEGVVNDIQSFSDENNSQNAFVQQQRRPGPTTLNEVRDQIRFRTAMVDRAVEDGALSPGQAEQIKRETAKSLVEHLGGNRDQYNLSEDDEVDKLISYFLEGDDDKFLGVLPRFHAIRRLSGVDEETGLNRTERKWLQAQADQNSDIAWQEDATLDKGLQAAARRTLESGEWEEELLAAYDEYQGNPAKNVLQDGLEWLDENVYEPIKENVAASVIVLDQWGDPKSSVEGTDWGTRWREARDQANNVSFGQAFIDAITARPDENRRSYRQGFDEAGQPLDQAYYDRRAAPVYNVASGLTDFAFTWYADPLVAVSKGVTAARAITRADVAAMSPTMRNRFLRIATTPSDELANTRTLVNRMNPADRAAFRVRERLDDVRDQIRAGAQDERSLVDMPAFKDDPIATRFFVEAANMKKVDEFGRLTDEYDDNVFDLAVASMYGHGPSQQELATRSDEFRGLIDAWNPRLGQLEDDIVRFQEEFERVAPEPWRPEARAAFEQTWNAKYDLERSIRQADDLKAELAQYESYARFTDDVLDGPDSAVLRNMRLMPESRQVAMSLRTSSVNQFGYEVTRYPRAAFKKRAGNVDLTRGSDTYEGARRYFDDMAKYGNRPARPMSGEHGVDNLTNVAQAAGYGNWRELRDNILQRILHSRTDTERQTIMTEVEDIGIRTIATKHGLNAQAALQIQRTAQGKRNSLYAAMIRQKEESRRIEALPEGEGRDVFTYADGDTVRDVELPMSVTELANYYVPMDLRSFESLLRVHGEGIKSAWDNATGTTREGFTEFLERFNGFWKPAVLLRGGYPIRNVTDGQLRAIALTNSFMTAANSARGLGIGTVNTASRLLNAFPRLAGKKGRVPMISQVGQKPGATIKVRGQTFSAEFARGEGDIAMALNSSDQAMAEMFQRKLKDARGALGALRHTRHGEAGHAGAWAHVLNNRVTKDPIWRKMLQGQDDDAIVRWLDNTPEGRALKARVPFRSYDSTRWVDEMRLHFDTYVGDDVLKAKLAADEVVDEKFLQDLMDAGKVSPMSIDEAAVEMAQGSGTLARLWKDFVDNAYHLIGTMPENNLMRNPFFRTQYRHRLQDLTRHLDDGAELTERELRAFAHNARQFAIKQTRRYMFTLADQSDLTHWFRFMSPFIGAQMEAVRKWGRIFFEHPESFSRLYVNGWNDLDDAAWWELVDQNGRGEDDPEHGPLENLRMQVPKSLLRKLDWLVPGNFTEFLDVWAPTIEGAEMPTGLTPAEADRWKKSQEGFFGVSIPKRSLNVSLQGDPFFIPGAGPIIQLPMGFLADRYPELANEQSFRGMVYRYLFPTGTPEMVDTFFPAAYMQQFYRYFRGTDDPTFTNMADNLFKQEYYQWEAEGRQGPPPDPGEILEKAKMSQVYFAIARFGAPFSFQLQPQAQLFIDAARQYQQQYPFEEAYAKFVKDMGDEAFYFWASNSQTNVDVPATSAGYRQDKRFRQLVQQHPEIAGAIVGLDAQKDAFNYAVYETQLNERVSPWDNRRRRERLTPEQAVAKAEATKGWDEWRLINSQITAELAARGLTSIRQSGAEDLAEIKHNAREALKDMYPGWGEDQAKFDKDRTYKIVDDFRSVLDAGAAPVRADWEGVAEYMEVHDAIAAELDARRAVGGSSSIEAAENEDLQVLYDTAVFDIVERNPMFGDLFSRYLDNHSIVNGSN